MKRALSSLAILVLPRSFGGRVFTASEFVHAGGEDRLLLRNVADSLYWRHALGGAKGAVDFHSVVWERRRADRWTVVANATRRAVERTANAWVSGIHSLEPANGIAIVQIARNVPASISDLPNAVQVEARKHAVDLSKAAAFVAQYSWVSWSMRTGKVLSVLKECGTPFDRYDA